MNRIAIPVFSYRPDNYVAVLKHLGAEPLVIGAFDSAEHFDGLLLPGGCDVNPVWYGQPNLGSQGINDAEDDLQMKMLEEFIRAKKPVLGVCRGMQLINVYFGGSLVQNIAERDTHNGDGARDCLHGAVASKDSWLAHLYGEHVYVNSHHHQAVDRLGDGIVLNQFAEDGILEGFTHRKYPIWAVQWHPERCGFSISGGKDFTMQRFLKESSLSMLAEGTGNKNTDRLADGRMVYRFFLDRCKGE
ncbi:MAG: gamma-glutamyl-gamma-aminobutyrate hydrolase family protein [Lachnospiraceae bacterium]|nr:gamma-glutamyl-gamma-aminobutyrate hydrolase family protein [Lachnospiraceae bacterium]